MAPAYIVSGVLKTGVDRLLFGSANAAGALEGVYIHNLKDTLLTCSLPALLESPSVDWEVLLRDLLDGQRYALGSTDDRTAVETSRLQHAVR